MYLQLYDIFKKYNKCLDTVINPSDWTIKDDKNELQSRGNHRLQYLIDCQLEIFTLSSFDVSGQKLNHELLHQLKLN